MVENKLVPVPLTLFQYHIVCSDCSPCLPVTSLKWKIWLAPATIYFTDCLSSVDMYSCFSITTNLQPCKESLYQREHSVHIQFFFCYSFQSEYCLPKLLRSAPFSIPSSVWICQTFVIQLLFGQFCICRLLGDFLNLHTFSFTLHVVKFYGFQGMQVPSLSPLYSSHSSTLLQFPGNL